MDTEFLTFDSFVDDLLESDINLLKGELDILLMQQLFHSLELKCLEEPKISSETFIAA